ncbi:hypothetical protein, partial [Cupriavidus sp. IDO]|uniref:hypothetical protein n=1 Tax=Cupriavidus sp. IDO TaxID=1539142 RepID=UPI001EE73B4B
AKGAALGVFSNDARIVDPRGMSWNPAGTLLYLDSGDDRILAVDRRGEVRLDSGKIPGLNPGGGVFGPDGRYRSGKFVRVFDPPADVPFQRPRGLRFGPHGKLYCTARDTVVIFDYASGQFAAVAVHRPGLNGQAVTLSS